jgi:hypothetical protein
MGMDREDRPTQKTFRCLPIVFRLRVGDVHE